METETPSTDPSSAVSRTSRSPRSVLPQGKRVKRRGVFDALPRSLWRYLFALIFIVSGLLGYGLYQVSQGPVALDFVLDPLTRALSSISGHTIRARSISIAWDRESGDLGFDLTFANLSSRDGLHFITIPDAWVQLSGRDLLRGKLKPTKLRLNGLTLRGRWQENGGLSFDSSPLPPALDKTQASAPPAASPAEADRNLSPVQWLIDVLGLGGEGGLQEVHISDSRLFIFDERTGFEWPLTEVSANLQIPSQGRITGMLRGTLTLQAGEMHLAASGRYDRRNLEKPGDGRFEMDLEVDNIVPAAFATRFPEFPELGGIELPGRIALHAALDGNGAPQTLSASIETGKGRLVHASLPTGAIAIDASEFQVSLDPNQTRVDLVHLTLASGTVLSGRLALDQLQYPITAQGRLGIQSLPIADFPKLWPKSLVPNLREWILGNLSQGAVSSAEALFTASLPGKGDAPELKTLKAELTAADVSVRYFGKLPPVDGVNGKLTYAHQDGTVTMQVRDGKLRGSGLTVPNGLLKISGIKDEDQQMALTLAIRGPVADALTLLDQPPLGFMKSFGLDPRTSQGNASIALDMGFPLLNDLKLEQIHIAAEAALTQAGLRNVVKDISLSDADLTLKVNAEGLNGTGTGKLNMVPVKFEWSEAFVGSAARHLKLAGTLDDTGRIALNVPGDDYLRGPVDLDLVYRETPLKQARVHVKANFDRTQITLGEFAYTKPAGAAAKASADLVIKDDRSVEISRFEYHAADEISVEGSARFNLKQEADRLVLWRVKGGGNDFSAHLERGGGEGWNLRLEGPSLDLSKIFEERIERTSSSQTPLTLTLDSRLDRLILGPKREARKIRLHLKTVRDFLMELEGSARIGEAPISVALHGTGEDRRLRLDARDAGGMLAFAGISDKLRGGILGLDGQPGAEGWQGQAEMTDYRLVNEPVLGKILTIASITGIPQMLQGEGIAFEKARINFRITPQDIRLFNGRATGLAIGFKLDGQINRLSGQLDLKGTLVPFAGINRILNAVPFLGDILTGGEGGGVFAWTFQISGPLAAPEIHVDPLSVLLPGVFHWLFEVLPPTGANEKKPQLLSPKSPPS